MRYKTLWVLLCLSSVLVAGLVLAAEVDKGSATLKIDVNKSGKAVKEFSHKKHLELKSIKGKCKECHHKTKAGKKPPKCGSCHTQVKEKDPKTGASGFKKAYHKQCMVCHKKQKDQPKLKKCKTCHAK